jgi:hypothetical protein
MNVSLKVEERGKNKMQSGGYAQGYPDLFPQKVSIYCQETSTENQKITVLASRHLTVSEFKSLFNQVFMVPATNLQLFLKNQHGDDFPVKEEDAQASIFELGFMQEDHVVEFVQEYAPPRDAFHSKNVLPIDKRVLFQDP